MSDTQTVEPPDKPHLLVIGQRQDAWERLKAALSADYVLNRQDSPPAAQDLRHSPPDLILFEPPLAQERFGWLQTLREEALLEKLPVVVTLITPDETLLEAAFEAGAWDVLMPPLRAHALRVLLKVRLAQAEQLKQWERHKNTFLATLGHELRNPLAAIHNAIQVIRLQAPPPPFQEALELIESQERQLFGLVDGLLDLARIMQKRICLRHDPLILQDIVQRSVEVVRHQANERDHVLEAVLSDEALTLEGDAVRLEQVVVNLLVNAIRYTPPGGHIRLELHQSAGQAVLSVCDNGIGIPPERLSSIFDTFSQAGPVAFSREGLGLGLGLSRRLVEMHGGKVEAHSGGTGRGSEFFVYLPLPLDGGKQAERPSPLSLRAGKGYAP